jgi:hypothetical protein
VSCSSGVCVPHCPSGFTFCAGKCVALSRDPANCGRCDNACGTGSCVASSCDAAWTSLLATGRTPVDLLTDATSVYFIDSADFTVNRVDKTGGSAAPIATGQGNPSRLAEDDTYLYWSNAIDGSVKRVKKAGNAAPEAVAPSGAAGPIAVDDSYVYWSGCNVTGCLFRAPKDGSGSPSLVWNGGGFAQTLAINLLVDDAFVYWSSPDNISSRAIRIDKATGNALEIAFQNKGALAMDAATVYIVVGSLMSTNPHFVWAFDKTTQTTRQVHTIQSGSGEYGELSVDETYVYRNGTFSGGVAKILKCGTEGRSATISSFNLRHLAVDGT